jgi:transposase
VEVELPETIEECHSLIRQLLVVIKRQQAEIDELKAEVRELKKRLNQNSQNSNRPPSSDGFNKPKPAFSGKKGKRGGQLGHRGNTLKRVENPDLVVDCEPESCLCGKPQWKSEGEITETRQVFEMPEPRLAVIEYRRVKRICKCGRSVCGEFPEKVAGTVQYGEKVQALVALLSVHGCLSYGKIGQVFADIYGYELNEATAQKMVQKTSERMPMREIKAEIIAEQVVNFDETGLTENGKIKWLHNASTAKWTYQFVHEKRGKEAMTDAQSVLPEFRGVAVHDCWGSYFGFSELKHAICNAHILRELNGIIENSQSKWAIKMKELLLEMYRKSDFGKGIPEEIGKYQESYQAILEEAEKEEPPPKRVNMKGKLKRTKGRNLLERLRKHKESVLRFAVESEVPFTNNQAERDIRPTKIKQKMSGGFRSANGTQSYCRIQSFISSLRKQSRQVFQELLSVIQGNHFEVFQT